MQKPRITLANYLAMQQQQKPTVAQLVGKYLSEMGTNGTRPVGESQMYAMKAMQRATIGSVGAFDLTHHHVIKHCRDRIEAGVKAPTVQHDMSNLSVVMKYAGSAWSECEGLSDGAVSAAKPFLTKHGLIGKSAPRDRRPTADELAHLIDYFNTPAGRGKARTIDMALMTAWQVASGRRISESCRALWTDWNRDAHTLLVRKMKDPRKRKDKVVALPDEAQAMLEAMWEVRDESEPRLFAYNAKSVSAAYTLAKHRIGIDGLRLHDSRRETASRLIERGFTSPEAIQFTGHDSTAIFERVYMRLKPEDMKNGPIKLRAAA